MSKVENAEDERAKQRHWNLMYERLTPAGVSWYQPHASPSLELVDLLRLPTSAKVIDVGGGASTFVDGLVARGFSDVTVLDVSESALETARDRVGAGKATWIAADLMTWVPSGRYQLWHDRAVYHFLTEDSDRRTYEELLNSAVVEGGHVILATFAPNGPERCSGLPVARYGVDDLAARLGDRFQIVKGYREDHVTPGGVVQPFTWVVARKRSRAD